MPYSVVLTKDAEADLDDIYDYILEHDSVGKADGSLVKGSEKHRKFSRKWQHT